MLVISFHPCHLSDISTFYPWDCLWINLKQKESESLLQHRRGTLIKRRNVCQRNGRRGRENIYAWFLGRSFLYKKSMKILLYLLGQLVYFYSQ